MRRSERFSRRRVLASLATGSIAAVAGCTYERDVNYEDRPGPVEKEYPIGHLLPDLPVHEHVEDVETGIETGLETEVSDRESFGTALEDEDIAVESVAREDRFLLLEFTADAPEVGILEDIGVVAGAFVQYVRSVDDPGRLEGTLLDSGGDPFGVFDVLIKWALEFDEGELPLEAYAELVMGTLETKREFEQENEAEAE